MSRSKSKRVAPKHQKAKLAALPFLFAVLGYVLLADSDTEDEAPAAVRTASLTASTSQRYATGVPSAAPQGAQAGELPDWSELATAGCGKCNPFLPIVKEEEDQEAPPGIASEFPTPEVQSPQAEVAASAEPSIEPGTEPEAQEVDVAALSQQPVRYFFQTNNRRVMLVGDQLLSEGQTLERYTVTRLEPDRIELEPADTKQ